jgi:hypothetical protein
VVPVPLLSLRLTYIETVKDRIRFRARVDADGRSGKEQNTMNAEIVFAHGGDASDRTITVDGVNESTQI